MLNMMVHGQMVELSKQARLIQQKPNGRFG